MLDSDERSGVWLVVGGIVAICLLGTVFSNITRDNSVMSWSSVKKKDPLEAMESKVRGLKNQRKFLEETYQARVAPLEGTAYTCEVVTQEIDELHGYRDSLRGVQANLQNDVKNLEEETKALRNKVRARATGLKLGDLSLKSGKQYHDVIVRRVTPVGMEISHQDGIARIHAPDLNDELNERFMWQEDERLTALSREAGQLVFNAKPKSAKRSDWEIAKSNYERRIEKSREISKTINRLRDRRRDMIVNSAGRANIEGSLRLTQVESQNLNRQIRDLQLQLREEMTEIRRLEMRTRQWR